MIILRLEGGLGNQMFQYAAARRLAEKHLTTLKLDLTWFETQTLRKYKLRYFNIWEHIATAHEIASFLDNSLVYGRLANKIRNKLLLNHPVITSYQKSVILREKYFHFDPDLLNAPCDVYMEGFWQSEKYFLDIAEMLRQEMSLRYLQTPNFQQISQLINDNCSISLHIRRGDYVVNPEANSYHGSCDLDYYRRAVEYIADHTSQPYFFVFSDDPDWVKENLSINFPVNLVSKNDAFHDYEELSLMSQCQHHIVANSSFSWWGAWLNSNVSKIVVAPNKWFGNAQHNTEDLIPDAWIRL